MKEKLSLEDADLTGKRILMRVDFNVPIEEGEVLDESRIEKALPSINYILNNGGKLILVSHLGRPGGERQEELSLRHVATCLENLLQKEVKFIDDCVGEEAVELSKSLENGECLLCENLRFHKGEKANDGDFSAQLSELGDLYANDAFATAHRAHASTAGVTEHFDKRFAGFLMKNEVETLTGVLEDPKNPFIAVIGGVKAKSKIAAIENLMDIVDRILIGGAVANTFFKALGLEIGQSRYDADMVDKAIELINAQNEIEGKLVFPLDRIVTDEISENGVAEDVSIENIPPDKRGADIGKQTIDLYKAELERAMTCLVSGTMGVFEIEQFQDGTEEIFESITIATQKGGTTIAGGGETAAAVKKFGFENDFSHVSTGGGASLAVICGDDLPGYENLSDR